MLNILMAEVFMYNYKGISLKRIAHDCFLVTDGEVNIYFDPFKIKEELPKADYIFVTHEHFDHFSLEDINKIIKSSTVLFMNEMTHKELGSKLKNKVVMVKPMEVLDYNSLHIEGFPAYNINKFREPGKVFHPKEDKKLGFIITINGVKIYHVGDSDHIPEMDQLKSKNIDILLIPISGTYVMTPQEAATSAKSINAAVSIPMHYGVIVGDGTQAEDFKAALEKDGLKSVVI
jgi:L-ascorbate metabolism protein UlaG (beta-lactamase superfamily)